MAKFNLEDYVTVEERVQAFRKKYPNGRLTADLVATNDDLTNVIVKTEVYDDKGNLLGSDLAQEEKGKNGFANEYSWVENATTSSFGRSLFNAGFAKKNEKKATKEEMQKVITKDKEAKVEPKKKEVAQETGKSPSKANANQLNAVISNFNLPDDVVKKYKGIAFKQSGLSNDVEAWTNEEMSKYLDIFEELATKPQTPIEEVFGDVEEIQDIPSGKWEGEPPTEKQLNTFNQCVSKATDDGDIELVKKAKAFLNSGKANKKNIFDWIDTETWSLKDGS